MKTPAATCVSVPWITQSVPPSALLNAVLAVLLASAGENTALALTERPETHLLRDGGSSGIAVRALLQQLPQRRQTASAATVPGALRSRNRECRGRKGQCVGRPSRSKRTVGCCSGYPQPSPPQAARRAAGGGADPSLLYASTPARPRAWLCPARASGRGCPCPTEGHRALRPVPVVASPAEDPGGAEAALAGPCRWGCESVSSLAGQPGSGIARASAAGWKCCQAQGVGKGRAGWRLRLVITQCRRKVTFN